MGVVLVTAGASGIGLATVRRFLAAGNRVAVCDISEVAIASLRQQHPEVLANLVDVADEGQVVEFVTDVERNLGEISTAVNNAGIAGAQAPIDETSAEDWKRSFDVNVHGAFYLLKAVVPFMKSRGHGSVVNISTGSVITLPRGRADYIASKWALEGLTRAAARELGPFGLRVNAIRPGLIDSDRMRHILSAKAVEEGKTLKEVETVFLDYISMRTKIQPEEIGDMAVFLSSRGACHVSGQIISVDGNIEWES